MDNTYWGKVTNILFKCYYILDNPQVGHKCVLHLQVRSCNRLNATIKYSGAKGEIQRTTEIKPQK